MLRMKILIACELIVLSTATFVLPNFNDIFFPRHSSIVRNPSDPRYLSGKAVLDFIGLVTRHGYPAEEHKVTTPDGYHNVFHRIPDSPKAPKNVTKPAIYLHHGFLASSNTWVLVGPTNDLAFLLADAGFDVWIGNARGNTYCRSHEELNPDDMFNAEFWKFSFHEMAVQDVTTVIDYILAKTGEETLVYIGHSMGTTISYVLLSERPEYNEKISLVVSLTPVAFWRHKPANVGQFLRKWGTQIMDTLGNLGLNEVLPQSPLNAQRGKEFCSNGSPLQKVCIQTIFELTGSNPEQLNKTLIPVVLEHAPAGGSKKTMSHYWQNIHAGNFQKYDYNYVQNFFIYGTKTPPTYNVKAISAPVAMYYGTHDPMSGKADVEEMAKRLPNVVLIEEIRNFTHLDFLFAIDVKTLLYDKLITFISDFINHQ